MKDSTLGLAKHPQIMGVPDRIVALYYRYIPLYGDTDHVCWYCFHQQPDTGSQTAR